MALSFDTDFAHLLARLGDHHIHRSAAHPASNGTVERVVQVYVEGSHQCPPSALVAECRCGSYAVLVAFARPLGVSVHEMVFGRNPVHVIPLAKLFVLAGSALPVVSVVLNECTAPLQHV